MTMDDLKLEGLSGRLGEVLTAVICDGQKGKEYRLPTDIEIYRGREASEQLEEAFAEVPFGLPTEEIIEDAKRNTWCVTYGIDAWYKLFSARQLLSTAIYIKALRRAVVTSQSMYPPSWPPAMASYLAACVSRLVDRGSMITTWQTNAEKLGHTFARFALPMAWDYAELQPDADSSGGFVQAIEWVAQVVEHALLASVNAPSPTVLRSSAISQQMTNLDLVLTDPPYYDAIGYAVLMDFFYVWLKRALKDISPEIDAAFLAPLSPKWDREAQDGELIDDASRFAGDKEMSKRNYEDGMARAFMACHTALKPEGRLVVVFAHKHPNAWETLVGAIIKAGFVVDGSWPIQTEREARTRSLSSAALSSSVWLVCRKRDPLAKAGWDTQVLKEMETSIVTQLRDFWDAGIRGPDFVWAATGPAMESYSRYPAVKKYSASGETMGVGEFLGHVRRIVVDFVVGRVLSHGKDDAPEGDHRLDDVTTYYLLHRNDFGLKEAPAGPCILYAVSCGLSERELTDQYELLARSGGAVDPDDEAAAEDEDGDDTAAPSSGGKYKLKAWNARKHRSLGLEIASGRAIPLIDQVHKLMQLWVAGDVAKVNDYLDSRGLRRSQVFVQLIQAQIEQSRADESLEECSILERLQNYLRSVGTAAQQEIGLSGD